MNLKLKDETITPHDLEKEQDMVVQYEKNFIRTELRVAEYLQLKKNEHQSRSNLDPTRSAQEGLSELEKFQYLVQSMRTGTRADRLVRSYPLTTENYPKVVKALQDRGVKSAGRLLRIWQRSALAGYSEDEGELPISIDQRLQRLLKFLRREVKGERLEYMREGFGESSQRKNYGQHVARMHTAQIKDAQGRVTPLCLSCKGRHWILDCASWLSMTVTKRMDEMKKVNSCFRSLRVGHMRATCRTQIRCSHCRGPHHTALHLPRRVSMDNRNHGERERRNTDEPRALTGEQEVALSEMHVRTAIPKALLATARVRIVGPQGVGITVRALLDQGSQLSFVHQDLLHHLTLQVQKVNAQIYGINDTRGEHVKQMVSCSVESLTESGWTIPIKALVVGRMTGILPSRDLRIPVPSTNWKALPLADPQKPRQHIEALLEEIPIRPSKTGADELCEELYKTKVKRTAMSDISFLSLLTRKTLVQLAIDEGSQYPRAAEALRKETYVDDILTGAEDSESAMLLREELVCLLQKGGFVLEKWASNDPTILKQIPEDARLKKIQFDGAEVNIQLHGFSDASEDAYAAAVYIRIIGSDGIRAELVAAKTRLAPVRPISIPRLELCAAVLLTCLITHILTVVRLDLGTIVCWTDATIVLAWVKTIARTLPTFVGNRVSKIQTCPQIQESSGEIPADLASRGVLRSIIGSSRLWWKGPSWLILSRDQWPKMPTISGRPEISTALSVGLVDQVPLLFVLGERFSSITTYNRVVEWILRFISNCRGGKVQSPLNPAEIKRSHVEILLAVQQHYFGEELKSLSRHKVLGGRSRILFLNPFQDEQGVLRVGGRLRWAPSIPYHQKFLPY
ncbi:hypothetical protein LAZ67_3006222 [Cordylochernes scorpioides]|uniref:Uncharacterized protein n=1 Tax=Cordylochernes scorpioides TaxID=51811 RepID=A0ABY6KBD2_9ARAC|nr:hypothetical protein LAZ67_3006222 [Cordylochernes scorpioides]